MGYTDTGNTITLVAKLTRFGRESLLKNNSSTLITHFSIGDSDANYFSDLRLEAGEVPAQSGDIGVNNSNNNSVRGTSFKSNVYADSVNTVRKRVESSSSNITSSDYFNGEVELSGTSALTFNLVDRTDTETDSLVNLFHSFGLPITETDKHLFTGLTASDGGFSDTALSGINQDNVLVIGIDNDSYGEIIDGKYLNLSLTTSAGTYDIYGTFQNSLTSARKQDANIKETSTETAEIGSSISFLFSDSVKRPNGDATKSWSTGFGTNKPFSVNKKEEFNLVSDSDLSLVVDESVGLADLEKGFLILTHPDIVSSFTGGTSSVLKFNHVSSRINQRVLCLLNPGEFSRSNNPTFTNGSDSVRISEIGLHDSAGNLLAVAKLDRQLIKGAFEFASFNVIIDV